MIRYASSGAAEVERAIRAHDRTWLNDAAARTQVFISAGGYAERSSIWARVKPVYMEIQHYKCIFCERALARREVGSIEHDVEHYRPKGSIKEWPPRSSRVYSEFAGRAGGASLTGYYWLAYEPLNYATACKPCNSILKSNFFPIAGRRGAAPASVEQLNRRERPFIIFPYLEDPERLITFTGVIARPRAARGFDHERALVTIDLFQLNRSDLTEDRFRAICAIMPWRQTIESGPERQRPRAARILERLTADHAPQAACARAFLELCDRDFDLAEQVFDAAEAFIGGPATNGA